MREVARCSMCDWYDQNDPAVIYNKSEVTLVRDDQPGEWICTGCKAQIDSD